MPLALSDDMTIAERLAVVRETIASAAKAGGRVVESVMLIAVSKTQPAEAIEDAIAAGQVDLVKTGCRKQQTSGLP